MSSEQPRLIPASLHRVRCFINTDAGLKVKPWATAAETLDTLSDLLLTKKADDEFWVNLSALLAKLTTDMRRRMAAEGKAVDNELLDPSRHGDLLQEIRGTLSGQGSASGGFRVLASALSVPALGVLCILGGVVTLGCESDTSLLGGGDTSTDSAIDTSSDSAVDPDPDPDPDPEPTCPHDGMSLAEIIYECVSDTDERVVMQNCLEGLHDSWNTGLAERFACMDCWQVNSDLECLVYTNHTPVCTDPGEAGAFDDDTLQSFLDNCGVLLYLGVRFE